MGVVGEKSFLTVADGLFSLSYEGLQDELTTAKHTLLQQSWMVTVALVVNVSHSQAIT